MLMTHCRLSAEKLLLYTEIDLFATLCPMLQPPLASRIRCSVEILASKYYINVDLSDEAWEQATLPVANAGLGIRRATDIALPAFISSVAGSQSIISQLMPQRLQYVSGVNDPAFNTALLEWQTRSESGPAQPPFATKQKVWDAPLLTLQEDKVSSAAQDRRVKLV